MNTPVAEFRLDDDDPILPVRITHNSEQIWSGNALDQNYNYLVYEFETEQHIYFARVYLDKIHSVFLFGPFEKGSDYAEPLDGFELDPRVLAFLRRRYSEITKPDTDGFVVVE